MSRFHQSALTRFVLLLAAVSAAGATVFAAPPALPVIPALTFNLRDYGANPDGKSPNTEAFRRVVAACRAAGGGIVEVPAGRYLTGPIDLASNLNLHLAAGATILFSQDFAAYRLEGKRFRPLLLTRDCHDVEISGEGTLDGQGAPWWAVQRKARAAGGDFSRPRLVIFDHCQRVLVTGVTLANSPMFHLVPSHCEDVTIAGVTIRSPADSPNTDGIDPSLCRHVLITRCTIDTGDDCIAVKSGAGGGGPCEDILITDCVFLHGHGLSIGSETISGVRNLTARHCTFDGTQIGIRLKSQRGRGGLVENLLYEDMTMKNVGQAIVISSYYQGTTEPGRADAPQPVTARTPVWRGIRIRNLTATDGTKSAGLIIGLPEMPVTGVTLENVAISAPRGLQISNARGIALIATKISPAKGRPLLLVNVEGLTQSDAR